MIRLFTLTILYLLTSFLLPVKANSQSLELKWLLPNPPTGEKEKVTIFNPTLQEIDLSDWQIDDIEGGSSPINLQGQLASLSSKIIEISSAMFNNSGDSLRLLHNQQVVEETSYSAAPKGDYWVKDKNNHWCFQSQPPVGEFQCPQPTPTPTPTPTPFPSPFVYPLAECYPLTITKVDPAPPTGEKEKIKLYNPHSFTINLANYQLDDQKEGGASPIQLEGEVAAQEEKEIVLTSGIWNNSGDDVRLICHSELIDGFSYPFISKGLIIIRDKDNQLCFVDRGYWAVPQNQLSCPKNEETLPIITSTHHRKSQNKRSRSRKTPSTSFFSLPPTSNNPPTPGEDKRIKTPQPSPSAPLPPILPLSLSTSTTILFIIRRRKRKIK